MLINNYERFRRNEAVEDKTGGAAEVRALGSKLRGLSTASWRAKFVSVGQVVLEETVVPTTPMQCDYWWDALRHER
jgi:hypothetical protein